VQARNGRKKEFRVSPDTENNKEQFIKVVYLLTNPLKNGNFPFF